MPRINSLITSQTLIKLPFLNTHFQILSPNCESFLPGMHLGWVFFPSGNLFFFWCYSQPGIWWCPEVLFRLPANILPFLAPFSGFLIFFSSPHPDCNSPSEVKCYYGGFVFWLFSLPKGQIWILYCLLCREKVQWLHLETGHILCWKLNQGWLFLCGFWGQLIEEAILDSV